MRGLCNAIIRARSNRAVRGALWIARSETNIWRVGAIEYMDLDKLPSESLKDI